MSLDLADIERVLTRRLTVLFREENAASLARHLTAQLVEEFAGSSIYFPTLARQRRDAAIRAEFDGTNHAELAKRYRVSRATIYAILKSSVAAE